MNSVVSVECWSRRSRACEAALVMLTVGPLSKVLFALQVAVSFTALPPSSLSLALLLSRALYFKLRTSSFKQDVRFFLHFTLLVLSFKRTCRGSAAMC